MSAAPSPTNRPVALVAGASRGLGLLIADQLLDHGFHVVITSRSKDNLDKALTRLRGDGGRPASVSAVVMDVSDEKSVDDAVRDIERNVGTIEVAIHVAGIIEVGPVENTTTDHVSRAMNIMAWGPIHLAQAVVPGMRTRGSGRFAVVTSIGGLLSAPHLLAYSTAKFAAVGFTEGLAASLHGSGVSASVVAPGLMRTGSHTAAAFYGDRQREYGWFAPAASLPLLSMDADRAARLIVEKVLAGKPYVILTPAAKVGARVRGLAPGMTTRVMGLANRALPAPVPDAEEPRPGAEFAARAGRLVRTLTQLGDRASRRNLEP